jgi:predicted transcriptional regulator
MGVKKKGFKSENLFKCILGLNEIESNVFSYLLNKSNVVTTVSELTQLFEKDRSSIQRSLQHLVELNLIERKAMSLKNYKDTTGEEDKRKRGYLYIYEAKDLNIIKEEFKQLLDKWYNAMSQYIKNLDQLFDCYESDGELC